MPSTTGYSFFGQRIDCDMSTTMPASFPHGFTVMTNFVDRYSAEFFLYFQLRPRADEVASSLRRLEQTVKHRLRDGMVVRWHTDNDLGFEGPEVREVAADLVRSHSLTVAHEKNDNPVAERNFGVVEQGIRAALAFAGADGCLWPWAALYVQNTLYYITTRAHQPPTSPYHFLRPNSDPADMSWAHPLFCDVTVRLAARDVTNKVTATGADGCYLGHDFRRNCEFVYVPSLRRLGSFNVTTW